MNKKIKIYPVKMPKKLTRMVNGVLQKWIPNPRVKAGGYWRKA